MRSVDLTLRVYRLAQSAESVQLKHAVDRTLELGDNSHTFGGKSYSAEVDAV